jgi:hemolysin activation/secretion protein
MGKYTLANSELTYPIIRAREQNLVINSGLTVVDSQSKILGEELYYDHIRPIYLGLFYNRQDRFKGINQVEGTVTQGLPILDASGDRKISRPGGHSVFTKFNSTVSRVQTVTDSFSLYVMGQGQYSLQPLLVPSQFGFGGSVIGRGYDPSELLGNQGLAGTLEGRYQVPPFLKYFIMQTYIFYDAGKVWNPMFHDSATSTGIGIRAEVCKNADLNFYIAKPLTHDVVAYRDRRLRAFFSFMVKM